MEANKKNEIHIIELKELVKVKEEELKYSKKEIEEYIEEIRALN